jgi:hypothetical protein
MTDERKLRVKKHVFGWGKVVSAIGALVLAVNSYNALLKKQEAMLEVISIKLNALTAKTAYLDGRIDGLSRVDAEKAVEARMVPVPRAGALPELVAVAETVVETHDDMEATSSVAEGPPKVEFVPVPDPPAMHKPPKAYARVQSNSQIQDMTYQKMPTKMADLELMQKQLQVQEN